MALYSGTASEFRVQDFDRVKYSLRELLKRLLIFATRALSRSAVALLTYFIPQYLALNVLSRTAISKPTIEASLVSSLWYFYTNFRSVEACSLRIQHKGSGHGCRTVTLITRFDRHVRHLLLPRCVLVPRA
jgi:hypothetical protein